MLKLSAETIEAVEAEPKAEEAGEETKESEKHLEEAPKEEEHAEPEAPEPVPEVKFLFHSACEVNVFSEKVASRIVAH